MNHGLPEATVAAIRGVLSAFPDVERALLYGSRAKGGYRPGSDIDMTLVGGELNQRRLVQIDVALDDLLMPYTVDLSLFSELRHPALVEHIRRAGFPLYERTVGGGG